MESRWTWRLLAIPGVAWLSLFFLVAMYAVVCVALGNQNTVAQPIPFWNPLDWNVGYAIETLRNFWHNGAFLKVLLRTILYVAIAIVLSILVGYPVAYYTARHSGRWRGALLVGLVLPFWINYLMRMLAWINLLSPGGWGATFLHDTGIEWLFRQLHLLSPGGGWLDGQPSSVVAGPRLRLHPVPPPAALRGARPDRPAADRGGPGPRRQPALGVPAGHAPDVRPGPPLGDGPDRAADVRRLLHRRPDLGLAPDQHVRQPDRPVRPPGLRRRRSARCSRSSSPCSCSS